MAVGVIAGTKVGISATAPATWDEVGYEAVVFTNIGDIADPRVRRGVLGLLDPDLLAEITAATQAPREVVVVNCSQCHGGSVRQGLYSTGAALARCGVIPGFDMTPEAALTKLYCLLAEGLEPAQVRARMQQDLAGELSTA